MSGNREQQQERLFELIYGLLDEGEAVALRAEIDADLALQDEFERFRATADILRDAAAVTPSEVGLPDDGPTDWDAEWARLDREQPTETPSSEVEKTPDERPIPISKSLQAKDFSWERTSSRVLTSAAALLLITAVGGLLYQHAGSPRLAADPVRLQVVAPPALDPGGPQTVAVRAHTFSGRPASSELRLQVLAEDGAVLEEQTAAPDERGETVFQLTNAKTPPDAPVQLVLEGAGLGAPALKANTRSLRESNLSLVETDRTRYAPGDPVLMRSLTVSNADGRAREGVEVALQIRADHDGPAVEVESQTDRGVALGTLQTAGAPMEGVFFAEADTKGAPPAPTRQRILLGASTAAPRREHLVRTDASGREPSADAFGGGEIDADAYGASGYGGFAAYGSASEAKDAESDQPIESPTVTFYPEGGRLAEGLENRVYFLATDASGEPLDVEGVVRDVEDRAVAHFETITNGRGEFWLTPEPGDAFRASIQLGDDRTIEQDLPSVDPNQEIVLSASEGVYPAGETLQCNVRSRRAGLPLVLSVTCRGAPVAQRMLVTEKDSNPVEIELPERADGAMRLAVHDYRESPPTLVAERLVYRYPERRLTVDWAEPPRDQRAGELGLLQFDVRDENDRPADCVLGVTVVAESEVDPSRAGIPEQFLLLNELGETPAMPSPSNLTADRPDSAIALDLVLGARPTLLDSETSASTDPLVARVAPPVVLDNLGEIETQRGETALAEAGRWTVASVFGVIDLLGALGLVLLLAMLHTLGMSSGARQWAPTLTVALIALFLGVLSVRPNAGPMVPGGRMVAFAPHDASVDESWEFASVVGKEATVADLAEKQGEAPPPQNEAKTEAMFDVETSPATPAAMGVLVDDATGEAPNVAQSRENLMDAPREASPHVERFHSSGEGGPGDEGRGMRFVDVPPPPISTMMRAGQGQRGGGWGEAAAPMSATPMESEQVGGEQDGDGDTGGFAFGAARGSGDHDMIRAPGGARSMMKGAVRSGPAAVAPMMMDAAPSDADPSSSGDAHDWTDGAMTAQGAGAFDKPAPTIEALNGAAVPDAQSDDMFLDRPNDNSMWPHLGLDGSAQFQWPTIGWAPLLIAEDGRATVPVQFPPIPAVYRVIVTAHTDDGRLGSAEFLIRAAEPYPVASMGDASDVEAMPSAPTPPEMDAAEPPQSSGMGGGGFSP